jgi:NAD(P)-dependent dehydrogenase (short-subunit alcohol dehydrogenase family)
LSDSSRPVALVADANSFFGPELARNLAARGFDLVLGDPGQQLVVELEGLGATIEAVSDVKYLARPETAPKLVAAALDRFDRLDSAIAFPTWLVAGLFVKSTADDLRKALEGSVEAPYNFLKAVVDPMIARGQGQILLITSALAVRPTRGSSLYSAARAGAAMLARAVASEVARSGVQVNSIGAGFIDYRNQLAEHPDEFAVLGVKDEAGLARFEAKVPLGRLGTMEEFASFCMPFVDGTSRFTTGQFVGYAGGWA